MKRNAEKALQGRVGRASESNQGATKEPVEVVCSAENEAIRPTVMERIGGLVRRVKAHVVWARVKLIDVRDETGARLKRCVVQMRLRHRPQVVFAVTHSSATEAVALAAQRLQRVLDRRLQLAIIG